MSGWARVATAMLLIAMPCGCDFVNSVGPETCEQDADEVEVLEYSDGQSLAGVYRSSPWDSGLVFFPGGARIRFEHGLGVTPWQVQLYVSFSERGIVDSTVAPAAGNQAEIIAIDDQAIVVKNGTCADQFLIVSASAPQA